MLPQPPEVSLRVLIACQHGLVRHGLHALLAAAGGVEVVAEAGDAHQAVQHAIRTRPDVILVDTDLPGLSAIELLRQLKRNAPSARPLMLGTHASEALLFDFLRAGAAGLLLKDATPAELAGALHDVHRAAFYVSPTVSRKVLDRWHRGVVKPPRRRGVRASTASTADGAAGSAALSDRERELLEHVAAGVPNRHIAQRLSISVKTVEAHKAHMVAKLGLNGVHELLRYAIVHAQPSSPQPSLADLETQP